MVQNDASANEIRLARKHSIIDSFSEASIYTLQNWPQSFVHTLLQVPIKFWKISYSDSGESYAVNIDLKISSRVQEETVLVSLREEYSESKSENETVKLSGSFTLRGRRRTKRFVDFENQPEVLRQMFDTIRPHLADDTRNAEKLNELRDKTAKYTKDKAWATESVTNILKSNELLSELSGDVARQFIKQQLDQNSFDGDRHELRRLRAAKEAVQGETRVQLIVADCVQKSTYNDHVYSVAYAVVSTANGERNFVITGHHDFGGTEIFRKIARSLL